LVKLRSPAQGSALFAGNGGCLIVTLLEHGGYSDADRSAGKAGKAGGGLQEEGYRLIQRDAKTMATLAGQRAQFTWALNQYNLAENSEKKLFYAKRMARYVATAPANDFTIDQVTQGQLYPVAEVEQHLYETDSDAAPEISETEALHAVKEAVDTSDVVRLGEGQSIVYAYGYRCAPDRLKVGLTTGDTIQRIVSQISTGTPDKPALFLEIRTHDCSALERAVHAVLEYRGGKVAGAGKEWFKTSRDEIIAIYHSIIERPA
jgi:T5orf172 domain